MDALQPRKVSEVSNARAPEVSPGEPSMGYAFHPGQNLLVRPSQGADASVVLFEK